MGREHFRWRVPGNANPFNTKLEDWNKKMKKNMSQRSIGILEYLHDERVVEVTTYQDEIKEYLKTKYGHEKNKSEEKHWIRPLVFMGFINYREDSLSLSIEGKNFLKQIHTENYDKALDFYLLMLLRSKYPTPVAKDIYLSLFPFRIIFKMLLEKPIPKKWFITKIPYIKNYDDLINIENIEGEPYTKWEEWVFPYLKNWGIIDKDEEDNIMLLDYKRDFIESALGNIPFQSMFFESEEDYNNVRNRFSCRPRNQALINYVLKQKNYTCFFDNTHKTFPSKTRPNFVEAHHIIPLSYNDDFDEELDCEENIIALCPNCHQAMHHAKNDYKEELLSYIIDNNEEFKKFNLELEDMKEIYFNNEVPTQYKKYLKGIY